MISIQYFEVLCVPTQMNFHSIPYLPTYMNISSLYAQLQPTKINKLDCLKLKVMSLTPRTSRFWTLILDGCSEGSRKHSTSPLWIRT